MKKLISLIILCALVCSYLCGCALLNELKEKYLGTDNSSTNLPDITDNEGETGGGNDTEKNPQASVTDDRSWKYTLSKDGTYYEVSKLSATGDTEIIIPSTHNGLPVKSILENNYDLTFAISRVTIPDSITYISEDAFTEFFDVKEYIVSEDNPSYKSINGDIYTKDGKTLVKCASHYERISLVIPEGVTTIAKNAAAELYSLTSITLPSTLAVIEEDAFPYCNKIVEIVNHSSLNPIIGTTDYARIAKYTMEIHTSESKIDVVGDYAFFTHNSINYLVGYLGDNGLISLPASYNGECYEIAPCAFFFRFDLKSVIIPEGVTAIGDYAFEMCAGLVTITIPSSVTSIGDDALPYWYTIVEIVNNSPVSISAHSGVTVHNGESLLDNVNDFLFYTYSGVNYLAAYVGDQTNISLPDSYKNASYEIYNYALAFSKIESITLSEGVTKIGEYAFAYNPNLINAILSNSVTDIDFAFTGCYNLKSLHIGSSLTNLINLSTGGLDGCFNLTEITLSPDNPSFTVIDNIVYSKDLSTLVLCPPGREELVIPDSVTALNYLAIDTFDFCMRLRKAHIGSGVASIDLDLFFECYNLEELTVSEDNPTYKSIDNVIYTKDEAQIITWVITKTEIFIPDTVTAINPGYLFSSYYGTTITKVIFENPNGWSYGYYYNNGEEEVFCGTAISAADLSDPYIAAEYLTDTYVQYVWVCE